MEVPKTSVLPITPPGNYIAKTISRFYYPVQAVLDAKASFISFRVAAVVPPGV